MPAAFVEDMSVFFADFGVPAVVGVMPAFTVIFDKAYIAQLSGRAGGSDPHCLAQSADLEARNVAEGSDISIDGNPYTVAGDPEDDGTGLSILQLRG